MPKEEKPSLTPARAEWLVEARADTQRATAKLYRLLKKWPNTTRRFNYSLNLLVGVSFALWRAAFYSAETKSAEDTRKGLTRLLVEMLENNAVAYPHEKQTQDWTFNYYAGNAEYRLRDFQKRWADADLGDIRPSDEDATAEERWEHLNKAFIKAVDFFGAKLKASAKRRLKLKTRS